MLFKSPYTAAYEKSKAIKEKILIKKNKPIIVIIIKIPNQY